MDDVELGGMTPRERAGHIMFRLGRGEHLTVRQVVIEYGISRQAAYKTLSDLSRVNPIYSDEGLWRVLDSCRTRQ